MVDIVEDGLWLNQDLTSTSHQHTLKCDFIFVTSGCNFDYSTLLLDLV